MQLATDVAVDQDGRLFDLRSIDCPTCEVRSLRVLGIRGGPNAHRYGLGIETDIVQCRQCGLLFPDPFPVPRNHNELYGDPATYFGSHDEKRKIAAYAKLVAEFRQRTGLEDPSILDVGSGRGEFLRALQDAGCTGFVGLEFSDAMIAYAWAEHGIRVRRQTIEEYSEEVEGCFDGIALSAVLEHVYDPDAMIRSSASLLRTDGVLYIDVPNEPHLMSRAAGGVNRVVHRTRVVYHLAPTWSPFHLFGFNRSALQALLGKHDLSICSMDIRAHVHVPHREDRVDRLRALAGRQAQRLANLTGTAGNMTAWAVKRG